MDIIDENRDRYVKSLVRELARVGVDTECTHDPELVARLLLNRMYQFISEPEEKLDSLINKTAVEQSGDEHTSECSSEEDA